MKTDPPSLGAKDCVPGKTPVGQIPAGTVRSLKLVPTSGTCTPRDNPSSDVEVIGFHQSRPKRNPKWSLLNLLLMLNELKLGVVPPVEPPGVVGATGNEPKMPVSALENSKGTPNSNATRSPERSGVLAP